MATESGYYLNMPATGPSSSPPPTAGELLESAAEALRTRIPSTWQVETPRSSDAWSRDREEATWAIRAPGGEVANFYVRAKRAVVARDVPQLRTQLANRTSADPGGEGLVVTRYLSPADRARLNNAGLSYIDATGNVNVSSAAPALFVSDRGADSDPWRGPGRPRGTLKGEPAAKVVRALADAPGPWRVRDLADVSGASVGSVYRVMQFLEDEELAERLPDRKFQIPNWNALLRRWSNDYQLLRSNTVTRWIAPRGLSDLLDTVRAVENVEYAVTGSVAASAWAAYAPARSAMVYVQDAAHTAQQWGLRETETGANVLLVEPAFPVVMERTVTALDGLTVAAPTQVAVDLMTGPGRAPAEAEELIEWMRRNEQSWR